MLQPPIRLLNPIVFWVARLRWSLHTKLLAGFLFVILLFLAVVGTVTYLNRQMEERTLRVARLAEEVARAGRIEYAVTAQMHYRAMALLTGDPSNDAKLVGARQDFATHVGYLEGLEDAQGKGILAQLKEANIPFQLSGQRVERFAQSGDVSAAMKVHLEEEHPQSHVLEGLARDLIKVAGARRSESLQELETERERSYRVAAAVAIGGITLALLLGYVLSWPLLSAVGHLDAHLGRVTHGDFSREVTVPNGDEMQGLAAKANEMMRELARARAALVEQNAALTAQARRVEELNRRLEERMRRTSDSSLLHPHDPDSTLPGYAPLTKRQPL